MSDVNGSKTKFLCTLCRLQFAHRSNMGRHMRNKHNIGKTSDQGKVQGTLKCPLCSDLFRTFKKMEQHLTLNHDIQIHYETRNFDSFEHFQRWKLDFERQTISSFVFYKSKVDKNTKVTRYVCHRSGFYCEALGKPTRQRAMKQKGSNKMDSHCPAHITATKNETTGQVEATYMVTHVGHMREVKRLRITSDERNLVADKLLQGEPIHRILQDLTSNYDSTRRISLTSNHDIHNIKKSIKVQSNVLVINKNNNSGDTELDNISSHLQQNNNVNIHNIKNTFKVQVINKNNNSVDAEHDNISSPRQQSENNNKLKKRKKICFEHLNTLRAALISTSNIEVVNYISRMLSFTNARISSIGSKTLVNRIVPT